MRKDSKLEYWHCFIGPAEGHELPEGCDLPMRIAVGKAFKDITGRDPLVTSSGWGISEEEKDVMERAEFAVKFTAKEKEKTSKDNPDERNKGGALAVRVYFKTNAEYVFPARDLRNARDIAARVTREGCWIINDDGTEEFFPITEIHKAKIIAGDK